MEFPLNNVHNNIAGQQIQIQNLGLHQPSLNTHPGDTHNESMGIILADLLINRRLRNRYRSVDQQDRSIIFMIRARLVELNV
jgi:hypothetical protein